MSKVENLCRVRDLYRAIAEFESSFEKQYGLCLNEGMLLCSLSKTRELTSGELADLLGLTASNASKVIKSVEEKSLIERNLGREDKRKMHFSLISKGEKCLSQIKCGEIEFPPILESMLS